MLLSQLIERLEEVQESHEGQDVEVLGIHQMSYPLREEIGAVWNPMADVDFIEMPEFTCIGCGELVTPTETEMVRVYWVDHPTDDSLSCYGACDECFFEGSDVMNKKNQPIVYIRLDGAPYDLNPYGSREAWSA